MKLCAKDGCNKPARWVPFLKLWAKGFAHNTHEPTEMTVSLPMCDAHKSIPFEVPADARAEIEHAFRVLGKAEPDFNSSVWSWREIQ